MTSAPMIPVRARVLALMFPVLLGSWSGNAQTPGPNVNMVSGTEWPGGDPFLQRQNEPSMAVSSRNSLHLFGGANDYRTVDLPGLPSGDETGDAWLGIFKSFNGGQTWISNLIPGYPQDTSPPGVQSPIKGFQAAADPTVRAGSNGLFYYSGIAFNRAPANGGAVFVARYVDDNNETADTIRYIDISMLDSGNAGQFIDKPSLAVDIPRPGAANCSITGPAGSPAQNFPAGNVYVAYARFVGGSPTQNAQVLFTRSTDCGATWSHPVKLSETSRTNQGTAIAIDPRNGNVYVVWRQFASAGAPDAILYGRSTDGGRSFSNPSVIASINPFDQGSTGVSFRTNAFPAAAVDAGGNVYVAWSERGPGPGGDARVLFSSSKDGQSWSMPAVADASPLRGHQIMPALTSNAGKMTLLYYDLREDHTVGFYTPEANGRLSETRLAVGYDPSNPSDVASVFNGYIADAVPPMFTSLLARRHTLDVRVAAVSAQTAPGFGASAMVSQYLIGATPNDPAFRQLQVNPPNLPMFVRGTTPFMGDYADLATQAIVTDGKGGWKFNDAPPSSAIAHAVWTDNRDVRPPKDGDWTKYTPIRPTGVPSIYDPTQTIAACDPFRAGMRNQNIYTSRITGGLVVASVGNAKQLDPNLQRGFTVFATNTTGDTKTFRFTIAAQPPGGIASFLQFPVAGAAFPLTSVDVTIPPQSGASRTAFVTSTNAKASVPVTVTEISGGFVVNGGLQGSLTLNADVTNPNISNPNISNAEIYNPNISNPNISNPNISNPNISNPNISNPNISNPTLSAIDIATPNISNPNISNPNISNPNISNPNISNPNISNADLTAAVPIDTTWTLTNNGNTAASYSLKLLTAGRIPQGAKFQLLISRVNVTPTVSTNPITLQCQLGTEGEYLPFSNVTQSVLSDPATLSQPAALDPSPSNASIPLAAGESVQVTLRTFDAPAGFDPTQVISTAVIPQAANTGQSQPTIVASGPPIVTTTSPLPLAVLGSLYTLQLQSAGGSGNITWTGQNLPPGLFLSAGGLLTGTPTTVGTFVLTATVTDQSGRNSSLPLSLTVSAAPVLSLSPQALPNATVGVAYSQTLTAGGGTAPYSFGLAGGSGPLPPGVTLNNNGLLSGTPTVIGAFGFTVQVSDAAARSQTYGLSISVGAPVGSSLTFVTVPSNISVGQALPPIQVRAHTPSNAPVSGVQVTLAMANNNPSGGRLTGNTTAITDATGVATFTGISVDRIGNYNLAAMVLGIEPSGSFQMVPVPFSIAAGMLENDLISVFPEQLAVALPAPLSVNASAPGSYSSFASLNTSVIPPGTVVDSYYLHSDPVGPPLNPVFQSASFTFPTQILGVQLFEPQFGSGDRFVGEPATQYFQGRAFRIGNPQDSFVISPDGHSVSVNILNSAGTADMRVIVATAQASTNILGGTSSSFTVGPVPGLLSTYAGKSATYPPPGNGQANSASFGAARQTALDAAGNLYFPDSDLNQVFKVTPAGVISVVAGNGTRGFSGDGGLATNAALNRPYGLALDGAGNLYIGDTLNGAVRRVDAVTGVITTIAGGGPLFGQNNVPALQSFLSGALGLAFDPLNPNNLYVAENGGNRIRKIDLTTGLITTAVGTGTAGYNGDGISATTAQLNFPWGVVLDTSGNTYIADTGNFRVRKVSGGIISTVAGTSVQGFNGDNLLAINAQLCTPTGVTLNTLGDLLITDNCTNRIRKVSGGIITTVVGSGIRGFSGDGGPATSADLNNPTMSAVDAAGNLYLSDSGNTRIRKVTGGTISTYAGSSNVRLGGDGGPAINALLDDPQGVALDTAGNLYVGDTLNFRVRRIGAGGTISTYAGTGQLVGPLGDNGPATNATITGPGIALDSSNNLFVVDTSQGQRIRKVAPGGTITTVAGGALCCYSGDNGPATSARIAPAGVAADAAGNLYIAEAFNARVRKVDTSGIITTFAGNGTQGFSGDNGAATSAMLDHPRVLAVDSAGNVYVADQFNPRVRRITPGGIITTVAGNGTPGFTPDGSSALGPIFSPGGLGIDIAGNLYIANGNRVQKVDVNGIITTVAGNGVFGFAGDGALAKIGSFEALGGVVVDPNGDIYVADSSDHRIRKVSSTGPLTPGSRLTITTTHVTAPVNTPMFTVLDHAGGVGALTWTLIGGATPPGVSLGANGILTGTPTATGTFNALVQLTDSGVPQQTTTGFVQIVIQ